MSVFLRSEDIIIFLVRFLMLMEYKILDTYEPDSSYKTGVINDLPGQTHNPASSDNYSHLKIVLFCATLKRTDDMYENSDHYRP